MSCAFSSGSFGFRLDLPPISDQRRLEFLKIETDFFDLLFGIFAGLFADCVDEGGQKSEVNGDEGFKKQRSIHICEAEMKLVIEKKVIVNRPDPESDGEVELFPGLLSDFFYIETGLPIQYFLPALIKPCEAEMKIPEGMIQTYMDLFRYDFRLKTECRQVGSFLNILPRFVVFLDEREQRPHHLSEHRDERRSAAWIMNFGSQEGLADLESVSQGNCCHPDVDAEVGDSGFPDVLTDIMAENVSRETELPAHGLADFLSVEGPCERIDQGVGDESIELVAGVERRNKVVPLGENGSGKKLDPVRRDGTEVCVDDNDGFGVEPVGDIKDPPEGLPLPRISRERRHHFLNRDVKVLNERMFLVGNQDGSEHVCFFQGFLDNSPGFIRRTAIGVDNHALPLGEIFRQSNADGLHHMSDRALVVEAGNANQNVCGIDVLDLFQGFRG